MNLLMNRRNFLENTTKSVVAGSILPAVSPAREPFVHHVYFWLANPDSEADKKQLLAALDVLKKVPVIRQAHIGVPASTNRDVIERSYQVSWLLFFDSLEDEEMYQKHPVHLNFVEKNKHLWKKVTVFDSVSP